MEISVCFRHFAASDALEEYTKKKFTEKLERFRGLPLRVHVTFSIQNHEHTAFAEVTARDGFKAEATHTSADMYESVDHLVAKLSRQLLRHKDHVLNYHEEKSVTGKNETPDDDDVIEDQLLF